MNTLPTSAVPSSTVVARDGADAASGRIWRFLDVVRDGTWRLLVDGAYFYRLRSYQSLMPAQRAMFYTLMGYALTGPLHLGLCVMNAVLVGLLMMFFGAYDNYWDWKLLGERNGTREVMDRRHLSPRATMVLVCAPWMQILPLMRQAVLWNLPRASILSWWGVAILGLSYMTPGLRLKGRAGSFFVAPIWACLLFFQAACLQTITRWPLLGVWCTLLFLLQCQAEALHHLDDAMHRQPATPEAIVPRLHQLRQWPLRSLAVSLLAALMHPVFLNSVVWSVLRWWSVSRLTLGEVSRVRRRVWHPVWSLYEFGIYAVVGLWHPLV